MGGDSGMTAGNYLQLAQIAGQLGSSYLQSQKGAPGGGITPPPMAGQVTGGQGSASGPVGGQAKVPQISTPGGPPSQQFGQNPFMMPDPNMLNRAMPGQQPYYMP